MSRRVRRGRAPSHRAEELTERVAELRRRIAEAKDLNEVDLYFHTQLVEYAPFRAAGHRAPNPALLGLVRMTARTRGGSPQVISSNMTRVPGHSMWHGWVLFEDGVLAIALHFDGDPRGYCSLGDYVTGETAMLRFSVPGTPWSDEFDPDRTELVSFGRRRVGSELN